MTQHEARPIDFVADMLTAFLQLSDGAIIALRARIEGELRRALGIRSEHGKARYG